MRTHRCTGLLVIALTGPLACADPSAPTPRHVAPSVAMSRMEGPRATATVQIEDQCDPTTFNAIIGPGTCVGNGTVTFQAFVAELRATHSAAAWRNAPAEVLMNLGETLMAPNVGGEFHTFTEVANFGGGLVPFLNDVTRLETPAPECFALAPEDFIPPGGAFSEVTDEVGIEKYQCCIHPWMRAVIRIR